MELGSVGRWLGVGMVPALFCLVGCGETGSESNGTGGSGTTGAVDGFGGAGGAGESNTSGGVNATGASTTSAGSVTSSGSGGSGPSSDTSNTSATASTGGAGGAAPGGVSNVEELCAAYPVAWGAYMARCHGGDAEAWEQTVQIPCGSAIQSESEGRLRLNTENAASCLDGLAREACGAVSLAPASGCSELFTGTVPAGEECKRLELWGGGNECEPGAFCNAEVLGGCSSVCSTYLRLGEGCTGMFESTPCAPGTQCDPNEGCIVPAEDGEECLENWHCESYHCLVPDAGTSGTCQSPANEGPCTSVTQCAAGLRCVGDTGGKNCVPPKPVGESCTFGWSECTGHCSLDGVCEIAAAAGEPCGSVIDPVTERSESIACSGGLFCDLDDQTCRPLLQPGEQCPSTGACAGADDRVARCDQGECMTCD